MSHVGTENGMGACGINWTCEMRVLGNVFDAGNQWVKFMEVRL